MSTLNFATSKLFNYGELNDVDSILKAYNGLCEEEVFLLIKSNSIIMFDHVIRNVIT